MHDIVYLMLLNQLPRHRRISFPDASIQQPHIIIYLGRSPHRRSRIPCIYFLFYGYGRRNAFDIVTFGFTHTPQKLPCISRQTFYITTLSLGI